MLYAQADAPPNTVTVEFQQATLDEALRTLARKFNRGVGYDENLLPDRRISIKPTTVTLEQGIRLILRNTSLEGFLSTGGNISLRKVEVVVPALLYGKVTDASSGETLPGANVLIKGGVKGTITDVNGEYRLGDLPPGTYEVVVSFIGYDRFETSVSLVEGQQQRLDIKLKASATTLMGVQIEAKKIVNNEVAVLQERKESSTVQDAISAEEIERTGSVTATQALQKVTGVSIKDGKYVAVRGLTDRNIVVQLNGSRLSSADPLRSGAVPLDILPAQLLDNISVQKTVLPDRPGDATGALVELKTRSLPDTFMISISAQAGWNDNVGPNGNVLLFPNGKLGFFGQKAKDHRLSKEFVEIADITKQNHFDPNLGYTSLYDKISDGRNSNEAAALAMKINRVQEEIDPYLAPTPQKATPNQIYSAAVSNTFTVLGEKRLGVLAGVNYYSRTEQLTNGTNNRYQLSDADALTPNNLQLSPLFKFREDAGSHNILYGMVGIVTYKFNKDHAVSGHYIRNEGYESSGTLLSSVNRKYNFYKSEANFYSYQLATSIRNFNTLQLRGEHKINLFGYQPQFSWNYSASKTRTDLPDFRNSLLLADTNGVVINNVYRKEYYTADVTRYFRDLAEDNVNIIVDGTFPLSQKTVKTFFKTGIWYLKRDRNYRESLLLDPTNDPQQQNANFILNNAGKSLQTVRGNLNAWLTPDAIGIAENQSRNGSQFVPGYNYYLVAGRDQTRGSSSYEATQRVTSLYAMIDAEYNNQLHFTGGLRVEDTDVRGLEDTTAVGDQVRSFQDFLDKFAVDQQSIEWLPSGTLIYTLNDNMNFRVAASRTLARPEIVELVTFSTYDASQFAYITGNNKLGNAAYTNLDFRWEFFPASGEVLSASVFYKDVENALERVFLPGSSTELIPISTISFRNNPSKGHVYGIELEVVKNLGFLSEPLKNLRVGTNIMLAKSKTTISADEYYQVTQYNRTLQKDRPLFEQPNVVFNANIGYYWQAAGLSATLYGNYTGRRLVEVNTDGTPSIYEYPATQFDFIFSKTVNSRIQIKGFLKNILDAKTEYVYQMPGSERAYGIFNQVHYRRQFTRGREIALGFTFVF